MHPADVVTISSELRLLRQDLLLLARAVKFFHAVIVRRFAG